jgi:hypothetical protein
MIIDMIVASRKATHWLPHFALDKGRFSPYAYLSAIM